jgi:hypothetical protein
LLPPQANILALKDSIVETAAEIEKLRDVTSGHEMEVACAYKWHEEEYEEPAKTGNGKTHTLCAIL